MAKQFCISIDHRRRTTRQENINRLKAYRARIVIKPKGAQLKQIHGDIIPITGVSKRVRSIPLPPPAKKSDKKNVPNPPKKAKKADKKAEKKVEKKAPAKK